MPQTTLSMTNNSGRIGGGIIFPWPLASDGHGLQRMILPSAWSTLLHLVQHILRVGLSAGGERCWTTDRSARPTLMTPWPSSSALLSLLTWSQRCLVVGQRQHIPCCALATLLLLARSKHCHCNHRDNVELLLDGSVAFLFT